MRPTTAFDDNVFDINALLHPGTIFDHPRESGASIAVDLGEARHPGILGIRCIGDRILPRSEGACRAQSTGHHRRDPRSTVRTRRRTAQSAGRQAEPPALHVKGPGRLEGEVPWRNQIAAARREPDRPSVGGPLPEIATDDPLLSLEVRRLVEGLRPPIDGGGVTVDKASKKADA